MLKTSRNWWYQGVFRRTTRYVGLRLPPRIRITGDGKRLEYHQFLDVCYFYHKRCFEIMEDPNRILIPAVSSHIYDWKYINRTMAASFSTICSEPVSFSITSFSPLAILCAPPYNTFGCSISVPFGMFQIHIHSSHRLFCDVQGQYIQDVCSTTSFCMRRNRTFYMDDYVD